MKISISTLLVGIQLDFDPYAEEINIEDARAGLRNALEVYFDADDRPDVGQFVIQRVKYHITGGLSWGDSPSDVCNYFTLLCWHVKLSDMLEKWAMEDSKANQ